MSTILRPHKREIAKAEINMVPLVDVALVLLIIFMITATFVNTTAMNINLPAASKQLANVQTDVDIVVDKKGDVVVNGALVTDVALRGILKRIASAGNPNTKVTIEGDKDVSYGKVVHIMSISNQAGLTHIVVATTPE